MEVYMMSEDVKIRKSKDFAIKIILLYKQLSKEKEFVLGRQILLSGTSIGANLAEANCAISKRDFLAKVYISFKECSETKYWLELLRETKMISEDTFVDLYKDCQELFNILSAVTKTCRERIFTIRKKT
jgi:four helix bundle protein